MFGLWKKKKPLVYEHWYVALDEFSSSVGEFYDEVEAELERRQIPDLSISRIRFSQGALGGGSREYLRIGRERMVFDVCSAPYGTSWFFSSRVALIPVSLRVWELVVLLVLMSSLYFPYQSVFGSLWGGIAFGASIIGILALLNTFVAVGTKSLDSVLLRIPCIGALYELLLRRIHTYYQEDARQMFAAVVGTVIRSKVEEFAAASGIEEVDFHPVPDPESPTTLFGQYAQSIASALDDYRRWRKGLPARP